MQGAGKGLQGARASVQWLGVGVWGCRGVGVQGCRGVGAPCKAVAVGGVGGIVGKAWMQLQLDKCRVRLDHAISAPFTVVDGVAQGKKASVHKFNTAAAFIKDYISQHILGAAIPTGTWQHRVLQHAEHIKPARYGQHDASLGPRLAPDASAARISVRSFAGEVAKLAFYADRVACVHPRD